MIFHLHSKSFVVYYNFNPIYFWLNIYPRPSIQFDFKVIIINFVVILFTIPFKIMLFIPLIIIYISHSNILVLHMMVIYFSFINLKLFNSPYHCL